MVSNKVALDIPKWVSIPLARSRYGIGRMYPLDFLCEKYNIHYKFIPLSQREINAKVERSHRIDEEEFYRLDSYPFLKEIQGMNRMVHTKSLSSNGSLTTTIKDPERSRRASRK